MHKDGKPISSFSSQDTWENWLSKNHDISDGIWIKFYKKDSGLASFVYKEALDTALCYGWIDGQVNRYDEKSYLQKFTPRRKGSNWSQRNTEHAARIIKEGKMKPAGLTEIEKAKSDGRWDKASAPPSETVIPEDFLKEINKNTKAKDFWEKLNKTNKYTMVWQIDEAKKEETRTKRIKKFVDMLENGQKLY
ncbi:MAG: YdeI/OmpD-associated family protein [Candidatus Levybacteria bacterium]|nr:YdeI/OmpD-associated family protein [Candidatus Levybacteria bacterium]